MLLRDIWFAELVNFDPSAPLPDIPFPAIYHAPTYPGDRFTMVKWLHGAERVTSETQTLEFSTGDQGLTAIVSEQWSNGRSASKSATWMVDPDFGYVVRCRDTVEIPELEQVEFCNFHPRHAVDDRPEFVCYPCVLWQHPSGRILRWKQNHLSAQSPGVRDIRGQRQIAATGFLGFFGGRERNPAIVMLRPPHLSPRRYPVPRPTRNTCTGRQRHRAPAPPMGAIGCRPIT